MANTASICPKAVAKTAFPWFLPGPVPLWHGDATGLDIALWHGDVAANRRGGA